MSENYDNLIKMGEADDIGSALQNLINDNLKNIKTSFLAKITSINENKVDIKPLIKSKLSDENLIINNCLVGFFYSGIWQMQHKLKIGDIGLAIVVENDISNYKLQGGETLAASKRFKDLNDSIFLPFSLFKSLNNNSINFILENSSGKCKLEFDNAEIGTLQAKLITLKSENTSLKAKLGELAGLLESLAGGSTSADGHGHSTTTAPGSIGKFSAWASSLNALFKD